MDDVTNAYPLTDDLDRIDWMIDEGRFNEANAIALRGQLIQQCRIADALEKLAGCVSKDAADGYPNIFTVNALR